MVRHGNPKKVPEMGKNDTPPCVRLNSSPFDSSLLTPYCFSYSPLPTRFRTVNPAFLASEIDTALGELNVDHTLLTGFLQAGQFVNCGALNGRRSVNLPPQTLHSPSHNSYSYIGMAS